MSEKKKHTYNSSVLALPPLQFVMGDIPNPDGEEQRKVRPFGANKLDAETKSTLKKLIGHIEETR
jgi:hypothetical protein